MMVFAKGPASLRRARPLSSHRVERSTQTVRALPHAPRSARSGYLRDRRSSEDVRRYRDVANNEASLGGKWLELLGSLKQRTGGLFGYLTLPEAAACSPTESTR